MKLETTWKFFLQCRDVKKVVAVEVIRDEIRLSDEKSFSLLIDYQRELVMQLKCCHRFSSLIFAF